MKKLCGLAVLMVMSLSFVRCASFNKQQNEVIVVSDCKPDHFVKGKLMMKCKKQ